MASSVKSYEPIPVTVVSGMGSSNFKPKLNNFQQCNKCYNCESCTYYIRNKYALRFLHPNDHFILFEYAIIPNTLTITPTPAVVGSFWVDNSYVGDGFSTDPPPTTPVVFGGEQIGQITAPVFDLNNLIYHTDSFFYIKRVLNPDQITYTYYGVFQAFRQDPSDLRSLSSPFFYKKGLLNQTPTFTNNISQSTKLVLVSSYLENNLINKISESVVLKNLNYSNTPDNKGNPVSFVVVPNSSIDAYGSVLAPRIYIVKYSVSVNLSFDNDDLPIVQSPNISLNEILFNYVSATDVISGEPAPVRFLPEGIRFNFNAVTNATPENTANFLANHIPGVLNPPEFFDELSLGRVITVFSTTKVEKVLDNKNNIVYESFLVKNPQTGVLFFDTTLTYSKRLYNRDEPNTLDNTITITMEYKY